MQTGWSGGHAFHIATFIATYLRFFPKDLYKSHFTIPYSGKISLVQIFAEKRPDCSEEIFAVFIFADVGHSGHTSTS